MAIKDLKARWGQTEGQALAREVVRRLVEGDRLDALDLGTYEGRVDLRGLWLSSIPRQPGQRSDALWTPTFARSQTWRNIDLSHSTFPINIDKCRVENVRFDRVGWQHWRAVASQLEGCTFDRADLRDGNLDGWNGGLQSEAPKNPSTRYDRCVFARTRTGMYGGLGRAVFENCVFESTAFPSPMWTRGATFRACVMRGSFRDVAFGWTGPYEGDPPLLDGIDATDATFESLDIYAVRGRGITVAAGQVVLGDNPGAATHAAM